MKIEIVNVDGTEYAFKAYHLNGVVVPIFTEFYDRQRNLVVGHHFREEMIGVHGISYTHTAPCDLPTYFDEMDLIFKEMDGKELSTKNALDALLVLGDLHLAEFGRIIDVDVEYYIDRILKVLDSISKPFKMQPIPESAGVRLRKSFREACYSAFQNYLYLNISSGGKTYLTKYKP